MDLPKENNGSTKALIITLVSALCVGATLLFIAVQTKQTYRDKHKEKSRLENEATPTAEAKIHIDSSKQPTEAASDVKAIRE